MPATRLGYLVHQLGQVKSPARLPRTRSETFRARIGHTNRRMNFAAVVIHRDIPKALFSGKRVLTRYEFAVFVKRTIDLYSWTVIGASQYGNVSTKVQLNGVRMPHDEFAKLLNLYNEFHVEIEALGRIYRPPHPLTDGPVCILPADLGKADRDRIALMDRTKLLLASNR